MKNSAIKNMVLCSLLAACMMVLSQIAIPMPSSVPLTLQTFAAALCGYVLGCRKGLAAVGLYLLAGLAGLPVFSQFRGGIGVLVSVTGGFLYGFLFLTAGCGFRFERKFLRILCGIAGLLLCHITGIVHYSLVSHVPMTAAAAVVSLPYLLKDVVSVAGAWWCARGLEKVLKKANLQ